MNSDSELLDPTLNENEPIVDVNEMPTGNENFVIGSGIVKGIIGKGGMAAVYKVWNKGLEKYHAVKIAFPNERQNYLRFATEAKIASKLKHTNIVEIKNVGEWHGLPYIEMEFVEGKTLRDLLGERTSFPPSVACAVAIFIVRALDHAHSETVTIDGKTYHGIIHRDLKPENIMLSNAGQITVMDFGIARPLETSLHTTQASAFIGTPQYAPPEQFGFEKVDHRADIYTVGEILYEMLTGCKVLPDSVINNISASSIDMYNALSEIAAIKKGNGTFKALYGPSLKLPSKLAKLVERCLEPDKNRRFQSARDLLDELEAIYKALSKIKPEECTRDFLSRNKIGQMYSADKKGLPRVRPLHIAAVIVAVAMGAAIVLFLKTGPTIETLPLKTIPVAKTAPIETGAPILDTIKQPVPDNVKNPGTPENPAMHPLAHLTPKAIRNTGPIVDKPLPGNKGLNKDTPPKPIKPPVTTATAPVSLPPDTAVSLQKQYGSDDPLAIASAAIGKKQYDDALRALSGLPENNAKKTVLLLEIYQRTGKFAEAKQMIEQSVVNAAEFDLMAGKIFMEMGNYAKAVRYFNQAQEKPCIMSVRRELVRDAVYCGALASENIYKEDKSAENLDAAKSAWYNVKKALSQNTDDGRYTKAVEALSRL